MSPPHIMSFSQATEQRRSIRALHATSPVPDNHIVHLAEQAIRYVPSAFNSQTPRLAVLFGENHKRFWSITADALFVKIGEQRWNEGTKDRIANFANSYATILFFDDAVVTKETRDNCPDVYKDKVEDWVHQSNGMHQYYLWTALECLGFGVNLQHYNPLIDEPVRKEWDLPESWILRAQMVFGTPKEGVALPEKVQKTQVAERVLRFGDGEGKQITASF